MVLPSSEAKGTSSPIVQALSNLVVSSRGLKRQRERPFSDRHQKSVFQGSDSEEERHEQSDQKQDKDEVANKRGRTGLPVREPAIPADEVMSSSSSYDHKSKKHEKDKHKKHKKHKKKKHKKKDKKCS